jgi:GAF domain-containing protein
MRWLVEVTALGKNEKQQVFVDAESWQKALQAARSQRGDAGPMSGFSIELLDEGCRAVDPMSRLRYEVRRAPEGAAAPAPAPAPAPAAVPGSSAGVPAAGGAASHVPKKPAPAQRTVMMGSGAVAAAAVPAQAPAAPAPLVAVVPSAGANVIYKREQDATESMPLTYREYVFLVPPATTEAAAEKLLQAEFEAVRGSLERVSSGKLVNLAVFDLVFKGKPPVPPLATLSWKDWRGAPVVAFPRRAPQPAPAAPPPAAVPVPAPAAMAAPMADATVAMPPQHQPQPVAPPPAVAFAPPAPQPAPQPASFVPQPASFVPQPASFVPQPAAVAPPPQQAPAPTPQMAPQPAPSMGSRPPTPVRMVTPTPGRAFRVRVRGEDLIADLFESMHDLHFVRDAVEGGDFCLSLAMEKLPSQAGIVHLYDIDSRQFLVTNVRGAATGKLLLKRHPENDPMLSAAMRKRRAIVFADATQGEPAALERYAAVGGARSVIVAPVMQSGRFLGAIELLNPLDGGPFTESEGNAVSYIAEQFAEFVAERGVVTDPEVISSRQLPGA